MSDSFSSPPPIEEKNPQTLEAFMRRTFKGVINAIAGVFLKLGFSPNAVTLLSLAANIGAGALLALGFNTWAGVVIILLAPLDAVDGALARLKNATTRFGGFLDSVLDRYAELFIFGGLLIQAQAMEKPLMAVLAYIAIAGSIMVSYTRARAEALGFEAKNGLLSRVGRYIVQIPFLLANRPMIALWILAILTNFTAFQRIWHVYRQSSNTTESA